MLLQTQLSPLLNNSLPDMNEDHCFLLSYDAGICQLPSRRLTGVSLMKPATKSDEDEEDGLSESYSDVSMDHLDFPLNPMVTTVYNATKWNPQRSHHKMICATKPARSCDKQKKPPLPKCVDY